MLKYVIGAGALVVVLGAAYYFLMIAPAAPQTEPTATELSQSMGMATSTYATSTFSVIYPSDYTVDPQYAYDQFGANKLIHGVKFTIPGTMATGTTLSADTYISVEQLPRARNCTADIYIRQNVRAAETMDNGIQYSLATSSTLGTGNMYEEMVYAIPKSSPCTAVRYVIHSTKAANDEPGLVQEFDRAALMNAFDTIRRSLQLNTQSSGMTP